LRPLGGAGKRKLEFAKWQRESLGHRCQEVGLGGNVLGTAVII